jgi:hypothetical protein
MFMYNQSEGGSEIKSQPHSHRFTELAESKSNAAYTISLLCFLNDECFMKEKRDYGDG